MRRFITPKWLLTHAFVLAVIVVFVFFGVWQLHRAESGNMRSWAYALEWPTFALLVIGFWLKIVRDERRSRPEAGVSAGAVDPGPGSKPARVLDEDAAELAAYNRHLAERAGKRQRA